MTIHSGDESNGLPIVSSDCYDCYECYTGLDAYYYLLLLFSFVFIAARTLRNSLREDSAGRYNLIAPVTR